MKLGWKDKVRGGASLVLVQGKKWVPTSFVYFRGSSKQQLAETRAALP